MGNDMGEVICLKILDSVYLKTQPFVIFFDIYSKYFLLVLQAVFNDTVLAFDDNQLTCLHF